MGLVTEAIKRMFSRNTTNAASQSGARVPIVNVNGDPIGNDSLANLASVLGGHVKSIGLSTVPSNGLNVDETRLGAWQIANADLSAGRISGTLPDQNQGLLFCPFYCNGFWGFQIYITYRSGNLSEIYFRTGSSTQFNNWSKIAKAT